VKGFATCQTTKMMAVYANQYIKLLTPDLEAKASVKAVNFGVSISIVFPSKADADAAFDELKEKHLEFMDRSTRRTESLRITKDKPQAVRNRDRVIGALWTRVHEHLVASAKLPGFKLMQSNGKLYVIHDEIPWELFKINQAKADDIVSFEVIAHNTNCHFIGIATAVAGVWADEAEQASHRD
jgi:ornithine carbamoyltransferase